MEKLGLNQLRTMFQEFYEGKEHFSKGSFPLVPERDKSLLLINSGMAPLKPFFAGLEKPPAPRMTTCQKCIRTGDIENVGYTSRHATFFEMLGSFSFGDYFKKESIKWGWEFITEVLKMPEEKVWASVYEEDDEAYELWNKMIGIPEERIVKLGKDDNFWEIGTGPCGPCSELYFDRGEAYGCDNPDCKPGCECDRYVEFWNHVFTQFNRDEAGNYTPLAHPNIDTGMGLERLACIMQEVESIFDVDTIKFILDKVVKISKTPYKNGEAPTDVSIRIITDHIRAVTFLIGDGVLPSNEGRGYVLRRLLRRAARHGRLLGIEGSFLADLSNKVIEISSIAYDELEEKREYIQKILSIEEEKFSATIDQGNLILNEYIAEMKKTGVTTLDGERSFKLYDTYGFPIELTEEILAEEKLDVDIEGFKKHMEEQKELARSARKSESDNGGWADELLELAVEGKTIFTGYEKLEDTGVVKALFLNKNPLESAKEGEEVVVVLDKTPFYAESGGQVSDIGIIYNDNCTLEVNNVFKFQNLFAHKSVVKSGAIFNGDEAHCIVDSVTRNNVSRNHSATHLLHKALKEVIGEHVNQAGSLVTKDYLRFDFTHFEPIKRDELNKIEMIVNDKISEFIPGIVEEMSLKEALNRGIIGLFGEKYGDTVRVVSFSGFSQELCGGTHVTNSGQLGAFKILSENGVASGVRRIEAITGMGLYNLINQDEALIQSVCEQLKTTKGSLLIKAHNFIEESKNIKKELEDLKRKSVQTMLEKMHEDAYVNSEIRLVTRKVKDFDINDLRSISDMLKAKYNSMIIVLANVTDGKVTFLVSVTDDLLEKGFHAGNLIKQIAAAAGGGGGGKADMAQAGAKNPEKIKDAFEVAKQLLDEKCK